MEERMYGETYAAEDGHWWFLNLRKILQESLEKHVGRRAGMRILDAGCGTGGNLLFYAKRGNAAGVDLSMTGLSYCRKRGLSDLAQGDVCRLPFHDAIFDIVNSSDVLYAIAPERVSRFFRESFRVLKPGGYLLINTAAMEILRSNHDRAVRTQKRYYKSELVRLAKESGFELLETRYWNSVFFLPVLFYRLGKKIAQAGKENPGGDLRTPSSWINGFLYRMIRIEWALAGALPFGTSLFCVARKPAPGAAPVPGHS